MDIEKECLYLYLPKLQKVLIILNIQFSYVLFQSWTIKDVHYIPYSVQQYFTNKSMWNISSCFGNIKKLKIDDEKPEVPTFYSYLSILFINRLSRFNFHLVFYIG